MRILYWLLATAAVAALGGYLAHAGARRRFARAFLEALRRGPVVIHADEPSISGGYRLEVFRGEAGGRPFAFAAKVDATGTRWTVALIWGGEGRFAQSWNTVQDETEHPLQTAYLLLRRHAAGPRGVTN